MSIFAGLESIVKQNCPLADYTWYGLGGNAEYLIAPTTADELQTVIKRCNENDLSAVYVQGEIKKLPALFLTEGKLTKRAKDMLANEFKNITVKEI